MGAKRNPKRGERHLRRVRVLIVICMLGFALSFGGAWHVQHERHSAYAQASAEALSDLRVAEAELKQAQLQREGILRRTETLRAKVKSLRDLDIAARRASQRLEDAGDVRAECEAAEAALTTAREALEAEFAKLETAGDEISRPTVRLNQRVVLRTKRGGAVVGVLAYRSDDEVVIRVGRGTLRFEMAAVREIRPAD